MMPIYFIKNILQSKYYQKNLERLREIRIFGMPVYRLVIIFAQKVLQKNFHQQASAIAYNFTLSVFPTLIFIFTLIPYIPVQNLNLQILTTLQNLIPPGIYQHLEETVKEIIGRPRIDLLSLSFFFAVYTSTSGVMELMDTFNKNYEYANKRGFVFTRFIAIFIALLFAVLLLLAVILLIIGGFVMNVLIENHFIEAFFLYYFIQISRYVVIFLVFFIGISLVYYIAPAVRNHWRFFSWGSVLASIFIIISTDAFSYYFSYFASYNKLYGSIGTLIALMVWLYLISWILLLGFEINVVLLSAKNRQKNNS